jgi:hypothetical protein
LASDLLQLKDFELEQIVGHASLKIENEDWLYSIIRQLISTDSQYSCLLEHIGYEYLSSSVFADFFELISTSIEFLTEAIWNRLRCRLIGVKQIPLSPRVHIIDVPFRPGSPFDGIIAHLAKKHGGNVADLGIVNATLSSVHGNSGGRGALTPGSVITHTNNVPNSWLSYDFKELFIDVTHYSIRSRQEDPHHHLKSWTIEGSINGTEWIELHQQNNVSNLLGVGKSDTFSTKRIGFVHQIRLRQHGKSSDGDNFLTLSAFELFGRIHK